MMHQVFDAMATQAAGQPERLAFRDDRDALSWRDLAGQVYGLAAHLRTAPAVIAIDLPEGVDYVVADLAATLTGRRVVPLPTFFNDEQRRHIIANANVGAVIGYAEGRTRGLPMIHPRTPPGRPIAYAGGADRVIYTSGSSGTPKGVIVGDRQLGASIDGLLDAVRPSTGDLHLSILPFAQLLEQIAGIFLPICAGVETVIAPKATATLYGGPASAITDAFEEVRPATSLLVPYLLNAWAKDLEATGGRAPDGLRFVAVGGAPTSPHLIKQAAALGIPAYEGYGLSECCAVVALNRQDENLPGTAGRPLKGLDVTIDDGEVVVRGPTVMERYLGDEPRGERSAARATWRTGDLGRFLDGKLVIEGRKDTLLITPAGRNISPEWIEARLSTLPEVASAALTLAASRLVLVLAPRSTVNPSNLVPEIESVLADIPAYARPDGLVLVDPHSSPFIRSGGAPDRAIAKTLAANRVATPLFNTQQRKVS
jgi:long-subunit acyl-CoA synthetase (AMP-forming)